ncbi:MAG TPA: RidA family protein [Thermomicrobiaceae bacterium]|nr:RidA family protein [Thermomicrobiaceae bacterium]
MTTTGKQIVNASTVPGLPYSAGVIANGFCFVAGQFGTDADDKPVGDVEEQTGLAIDHLEAVLRAAGSDLSRVVRTTVYLCSYDDFPAMNRAYRERFGENPPARVSLRVAELLFGARVEIDAIAVVPEG